MKVFCFIGVSSRVLFNFLVVHNMQKSHVLIVLYEFHLNLKMQITAFFTRCCDVQCIVAYVWRLLIWQLIHIPHSYLLCAFYMFLPCMVNIQSIFNSYVDNWYQFYGISALRCFHTLTFAILLQWTCVGTCYNYVFHIFIYIWRCR